MPTIYRYIGFVISFFTHEHLPVHVHVEKGGKRNKFELIYRRGELNIVCKKIGNSEPLSSQEEKLVKEFLYRKHIQIVNK